MILKICIVMFLITNVGAINCKNNPCMYGICKNVGNSSYTCYCIDGYTGVNCEINFNECWSDPCMNGGTCLDGIANFNCTCPEGFTGERCEVDAVVCSDLLCKNGGTCHDGLGVDFTCECAEGWIGVQCENDVNECLHSPCQNGGLCINLQPSYTCACLFGFTGKNCDEMILPCEINTCENNALCLLEDNQNTCYCVPDYHGASCELKYNNCEQNTSVCQNGGTCVDDFVNFTCICLPQYSGRYCSFELDGNVSFATETLLTQTALPYTFVTDSTATSGTNTFSTEVEFVSTDGDQIYNETETSTEEAPSSTTTDKLQPMSTTIKEFFTFVPLDLISTYKSTGYATSFPTYTSIEQLPGSTALMITDTFATDVTSVTTTTPPETTTYKVTSQEGTEKDLGRTHSLPTESVTEPTVSKIPYTTEKEIGVEFTDSTTLKDYSMMTTYGVLNLKTDLFDDAITTMLYPTMVYNDTTVESTSKAFTPLTTENVDYCDQSGCIDKSSCSKFGVCNCIDTVKNIGFNGTSYIRHDVLMSNNVLLINVSLVTRSKNGILLHTLFDNERYALLHLRLGQLQLQLSCGSQKILFGTIDAPINNGFIAFLTLSFQYKLEESIYKCITKLYINDTLIMSGEQAILSNDVLPRNVRLYLGGIPVAVPYYISHSGLGFVGCINSLHVHNKKRNLLYDAIEIFQISNCETFNCFLNPCENSGFCEDVNGIVKCNCLPGYIGKYCEKSVCDNNPCYLGSTCITFPGSTFICVCPLGKHGLLCEKDLDISVPSFSTILPGLSSYLAFGFKNSLKNYLELNLRFKPLFNEQISLIAYIGQSNVQKKALDYFAVTYVQGYIMLTWDLGSGVRRIFTDVPLNITNNKFYTLNVGRKGRLSWMFVEGIGNVTGSSYGSTSNLDVSPILYIGGHKSKNFEKLPHDLPLHTGFIGCMMDIQMQTEDNLYKIQESNHVVGRNIGECNSNECSSNSCNNGAVCLNHGPSYRCICMRGWEGPDCTQQSYVPRNVCSTRI